jgi:acyl-CoA thioesterase FadM
MVFDFEIHKSGEEVHVASASSLYVFIALDSVQPARVPDELRRQIGRFEGKDFSEASLHDTGNIT